MPRTYDVVVIGAGVFGAWTAHHLRRAGKSVLLVDQYGPANARASSGGETRILRMGYGRDEIYTRWSRRSLAQWQDLFARLQRPELFQKTGVLWLARENDPYTAATEQVLRGAGVSFEKLDRAEIERRFPQIACGPVTWALFEPDSGTLLARRAVQAAVDDFLRSGGEYQTGLIAAPPPGRRTLAYVRPAGGERIQAGVFVFACGPWLPKLFGDLLHNRLHPTRQEVYFFGVPAGDRRFAPPSMPAWIDFGDEIYGIPDLENRGFKVALDRHGPPIDPDAAERTVTPATLVAVRRFLARRFPLLKDAPLVEARVCQYENTSSGDFLIDRHPGFDNVWLVGGGSGHGFKHGPAVGEYVAERLTLGGAPESRFSLSTKAGMRKRTVF